MVHITSTRPLGWEYLDDGVLILTDGKVSDLRPAQQLEQAGFDLTTCESLADGLLLPGFIDTHVHSPQIDVIGSYGEQLLDWLNRYTFPAEIRFADEAYAETAAADFLDGLLRAGTTTAAVYVTSHKSATEKLFQAAYDRGMRLIAGKVLMDQNAPDELLDSAGNGIEDSRELIEQWHGRGRLGYAITPRFAGSSTSAQLSAAGRLHRDYPDTWVQTHLSENHSEIEWVRGLHPESDHYLGIYDDHGLLTPKSIFGHCLHLSDEEVLRMADAGGKVAFCPSSNLFLGSGLLDIDRYIDQGIDIGLATDVGAGTSLSMLRTMADAYKVCQLQGRSLSPMEALSLATLAAAETLGLASQIGNFEKGKEADLVLLEPVPNSLLARRIGQVSDIEEELFLYLTLGDESVVSKTLVAGNTAWESH